MEQTLFPFSRKKKPQDYLAQLGEQLNQEEQEALSDCKENSNEPPNVAFISNQQKTNVLRWKSNINP
jgi:hypothetical protein